MDTNSNIPVAEIKVVMLAHLGEFGYGPGGHMTRAQWRGECMLYLLKGKEEFKKWQEQIVLLESLDVDKSMPFGYSFDIGTGMSVPIANRSALDFIGVTFESINANGFIFMQDALFDAATFVGNAGFNNCRFIGMARFGFSNFIESARFGEAIFRNSARFESATFCRMASFRGASFEGEIQFQKANFRKANFEDAKFGNVGHFEEAIFHLLPPTFRGCQIDNTRLEFSDDICFSSTEFSEDAIKNISFLKRLADEHGQTDQALNFNAMELRAKRLQTEPKSAAWSFKAVTWLYEILSDYGRSFTRPIIFYALLIWLGFLYAYGHIDNTTEASISNSKLCEPKPLNLSREKAAVEYAMFRAGGLMDFTDTGKQNNAVNCRLFEEPIEPPLMRAWGIFKGIASIALLFLAALGLRNKYRIK